ncbi:MAG TPA: hypothetical protein DCY27_01855 [Desulfobacterales bacterium]|nr:hypothetical protein [Desulfobacterales bacterium]
MRTPGAVLLRVGLGPIGHVAISDGKYGTVEAHSAARGVIAHTALGRRWTHGVLVPGVKYEGGTAGLVDPVRVYRLTRPYMTGEVVRGLQVALMLAGYSLVEDGVYGPLTYATVLQFQQDKGLLVDGEAGTETFGALGLEVR